MFLYHFFVDWQQGYSLTHLSFLFLLYYVDTIDPSEIFLEYFADISEAFEVKPLHIANQLFSANLLPETFKDLLSMSGDAYDKADKVVNELQQQVKEKGIKFLKSVCDFFLKQSNQLKDIGVKMKSQLESKI